MFALVTAEAAAGLDPDLEPLVAALGNRLGPDAVAVVNWDDPDVRWDRFDAAIIRSTWDYTARLDEFLGWVTRVGSQTRLVNPPEAVRWSADKRYLADIERSGISIAPTTWVAPGEAWTPGESLPLAESSAHPVSESRVRTPASITVVKPTVGAGASGARRCAAHEISGHIAALHADGLTAMVQPYLNGLDRWGETSLCFVATPNGGLELSHAFSKGPILATADVEQIGDLFAKEEIGERTPTDAEIALARRVLSCVPVRALGEIDFARVDVAPHHPDGDANREREESLVLCELELIEPSFYLATSTGAAERLADAFVSLLSAPAAGDT